MTALDTSILGILSRRISTALTAGQMGKLMRPPVKGRAVAEIQKRLQVLQADQYVTREGPAWMIAAEGIRAITKHREENYARRKPKSQRPHRGGSDGRDGGS